MGSQLDVFEKEPNNYITEEASPPTPPSGIPASTAGIFGVAEWGPVNVATLIRSYEEFKKIFGELYSTVYRSLKQIKKFFDNGGKRLYFVRVVHMTDPTDPTTKTSAASVGYIYDDSPGTASVVAAASAGGENTSDPADVGTSGGNGVYTGVTGSFRVEVTTAGAFGDAEVTVYFTPSGGDEVEIRRVTPVANTMFSLDNGATFKLVDGGVDGLTLADEWTIAVTASDYVEGDRRINVSAKYDGAIGDDITIDVLEATGGVVGEFKLMIYLDGAFKESYDNLSLDPTAANYFETATANSSYIVLEDTSNVNDVGVGLTATLSGGADGLTSIGLTDYKGDISAQTGMRALSVVPTEEPLIIFGPDVDAFVAPAAMQRDIADFCDDVMVTSFGIISVKDLLTPAEAKTYQLTTLAKDSSRLALYYPFVVDEDDDEYISPVGAIAGTYSRFAYDVNKGIWYSPAGTDAILKGIKNVRTSLNSTNAGMLNEVRVNCLKNLSGVGVVIWGARTCSIAKAADFKYIGARLNTSDIEARISKNTKWAALRPHDSNLYADITTTVKAILNRRYLDGGLDGTKVSEAYGVVCNSDINTQELKNLGLVSCRVGIRNKQTAEFIWFNITQYASGGTIAE